MRRRGDVVRRQQNETRVAGDSHIRAVLDRRLANRVDLVHAQRSSTADRARNSRAGERNHAECASRRSERFKRNRAGIQRGVAADVRLIGHSDQIDRHGDSDAVRHPARAANDGTAIRSRRRVIIRCGVNRQSVRGYRDARSRISGRENCFGRTAQLGER